jgi:inositol oxygenase
MSDQIAPLSSLEEWEEFLKTRYPEGGSSLAATTGLAPEKPGFREYETTARPTVREFYRLNHLHQTHAFVEAKRREYLSLDRKRMGIWQALEYLNTLVDDSDPDTELSQLEHLLQTAEGIREADHPGWFILTGLIHDLGKILCLWGEPQWAVVGDTFPVGCAHSEKIVFHRFFAENPDSLDPRYRTRLGIYDEGCGLESVLMSWGHDEYLYQVVKDYLPEEALAMIRYHSFYPWHREGEYGYLTSDRDRAMLPWVQKFNPYDLYTKKGGRPDVKALRPFYEDLIREYFPAEIRW